MQLVVVSSFCYGLTFMNCASHYCVGTCGLSSWPSDVCCPYQYRYLRVKRWLPGL